MSEQFPLIKLAKKLKGSHGTIPKEGNPTGFH